jgi:phospholipase C
MRNGSFLGGSCVALTVLAMACSGGEARVASTTGASTTSSTASAVQTVFLILLENHNWADIQGSPSAPYLNGTILPQASYAKQYFNPPSLHPSEPNYIWLEAGSNLGVTTDSDPSRNHIGTTAHLATQLNAAGIAWKSYQEDISGTVCPLTATGKYAPKHNPFVFFDDITGARNAHDAGCIAHNRPYTELAGDLASGKVARYNFLTPNLCNDMHGASGCPSDEIQAGDDWLSRELPKIMASSAYQNNGAIFITWDESEGAEVPIGMIVLSPLAKGHGYSNSVHYTHSSTLRTMQEIFGVSPFLGDAANANDLGDLFQAFP